MHFKSVFAATVKSSAKVVHEIAVPKNASINEAIAIFDHFAKFCAYEMGVSVEDIEHKIQSAEGKFFFEMDADLISEDNPFTNKLNVVEG